jgi:hypothetical protein
MTRPTRKRTKAERSKRMSSHRDVLVAILGAVLAVLGTLIYDHIKTDHDNRPPQIIFVVPPGASPLVSQADVGAGDRDGALKNPSLPIQRSPSSRFPGRDM